MAIDLPTIEFNLYSTTEEELKVLFALEGIEAPVIYRLEHGPERRFVTIEEFFAWRREYLGERS